MKTQQNEFVIIGPNHINTLGLIRSLGENGVKPYVIIFDSSNNFVSSSRYIKKSWIVNPCAADVLNAFHEISLDHTNDKPFIVPSSDMAVKILDVNYNLLRDNFFLPNCNYKQGEILKRMDKYIMCETAAKADLNVPKGILVNINRQSYCFRIKEELTQNQIQFPIIIKALSELDKNSISICRTEHELKAYMKNLNEQDSPFFIQEYIIIEEEFGISGYSYHDGNSIFVNIPGIIHKIRRSKIALGSTTYAKITPYDIDYPIDGFINYLNAIKYTGIFDIEMIRDNKGRFYFIEINYRNGAYGYAYLKAGDNLPLGYACLVKNGGVYENKRIKEKYLINDISDLQNVKDRSISFFKYLKDYLSSNVHLLFNLKDIKPFIYKLIMR